MSVGTIALIVTAAAILALWSGILYGLPYLIDRDDAIPDGQIVPRHEGHAMSLSELPKRSAFVGPQRSVYCDVPTELMERYLAALNAWTDAERSKGTR